MYGFDVKQPASIADAVVALKEEDEQALGGSSIITNTRAIAADAFALLSLDGNDMIRNLHRSGEFPAHIWSKP